MSFGRARWRREIESAEVETPAEEMTPELEEQERLMLAETELEDAMVDEVFTCDGCGELNFACICSAGEL